MRVGLVSDTHGLLRPRVLELLRGCDRILHAGDVGDAAILERLNELAPLVAVRGNVDDGPVLGDLPMTASGSLGAVGWRMTHRPEDIPATWLGEPLWIFHGHTHRPELRRLGSATVLNPGSCGPRRFHLPVALAILRVAGDDITPELIELQPGESPSP